MNKDTDVFLTFVIIGLMFIILGLVMGAVVPKSQVQTNCITVCCS